MTDAMAMIVFWYSIGFIFTVGFLSTLVGETNEDGELVTTIWDVLWVFAAATVWPLALGQVTSEFLSGMMALLDNSEEQEGDNSADTGDDATV